MDFNRDGDEYQRQQYDRMVKLASKNSPLALNCAKAFFTGGFICCVGQAILLALTEGAGLDKDSAASFTTMTMIFLGTTLTGIGVYDKVSKFGGAGAAVPVTGFANSVAAPAVEFKKEGWVTGMGAKIFSIAGPVLVYGISASVAVGLIYWILMKVGIV